MKSTDVYLQLVIRDKGGIAQQNVTWRMTEDELLTWSETEVAQLPSCASVPIAAKSICIGGS